MPKSKKSESLKPGDIVTQGRRRDKLRVLQVNKGNAVLVETVKNGSDEYATFYAPKDDLRVVEAGKAGDDKQPEKQLFLVTFMPAGGEQTDQVEVEAVAAPEDIDDLVALGVPADAEIVSVEPVKPV